MFYELEILHADEWYLECEVISLDQNYCIDVNLFENYCNYQSSLK